MRINNNFNVLPFYDSLQKLNSNKWYAFGQHYPLICPNNALLPFQFIVDTNITLSNIEAINVNTQEVTDLGIKPEIQLGSQTDASYYVVKMPETTIQKMTEGLHYLRIKTSDGYIYSEEFIFTDNISEYIKLEYWNEDNLNFNGGEINFEDGFKFNLYIQSTIGKPEYEFEEELTKRLGYKFIESQTSNKIYKFNFLAPEYICDAMRLVRLCDYIKLTTKFESYNALSLSYEPKWKENGDLAAVDVEFETDCIIQKLESFNRRLKESFYNALLANESEPILLDSQTVAQYYTEYTATAYVNGRLIRQLDAISSDELESSMESLVLAIDNQSDVAKKAKKIFLSDIYKYLSDINKLFKGHYDENGNLKWIEALAHLGINGGISSYINNGTLDLPSLYAGLPIDNNTLYWEETTNEDGSITKVLKAAGGGNGGGGVADSIDWTKILNKPTTLEGYGIADKVVSSNNDKRTIWGQPLKGTDNITGDLTLGSTSKLIIPSFYEYHRFEVYANDEGVFIGASDRQGGVSSNGTITIGGIKNDKWDWWLSLLKINGDTKINGDLVLSADDGAKPTSKGAIYFGGDIYGASISSEMEKQLSINAQNGVLVNTGLLTYNKKEGYFQFDGNLVVTGGLTTFADSGAGNQWIMDAETLEEVTSDNKFKVYSAKVTSKIVESVNEATASISEATTNASNAITKLKAIKTALSKLSSSSSASAVGSALNTLSSQL